MSNATTPACNHPGLVCATKHDFDASKISNLSSENEKLAGMVSSLRSEADALRSSLKVEMDECIYQRNHGVVDAKDATIASLRAELEREIKRGTVYYEFNKELITKREKAEAALTQTEAELRNHREAAKGLEDFVRTRARSHSATGDGVHIASCSGCEAGKLLASYAALTAPQAPEEGKPR